MDVLRIILIIIAIFIIWEIIENKIFITKNYEIVNPKIPSGFDGARFLYLVDLHNCTYGRYNKRLKKAVDKINPDYILIGGDFLSRSDRTYDKAVDLITYFAARYPVFFENGNHETKMKAYPERYRNVYQDFYEFSKGSGVRFINNEHFILKRGDSKISLDSLELSYDYFRHAAGRTLDKKDINSLLGKPQENIYHLLLAHSPKFFDAYADWGADLILSGHYHGGIVRIPFVGGVISTEFKLFPKYTRGRYTKDNSTMLVSAGMGTHTIKVRFLNPAEMLLITLRGNEK